MNESSISQTEADARSRCSRVKLLINCPRARDSTPSGRIDVRLIKTLQRLAGKHLKPSLRISTTSRSTDFAYRHHRDGKNPVCKVEGSFVARTIPNRASSPEAPELKKNASTSTRVEIDEIHALVLAANI